MTHRSPASRRRFVVSDPSFLPTTRQMALAVAPELSAYVTPYFVGPVTSTLTRMPIVGRELVRRAIPESLARCASTALTTNEFTRIGLRHLGVRRFDYRLLWAKNVRFDRAVARLLQQADTGVICQCGAALETFRSAKDLGVATILDYPIARHEFGRSLLEREAQLHPDFADTVVGHLSLTPHDRELERLGLEVAVADRIIVGSQFAAASFEGVVPPERVTIIPYGVDTAAFNPGRRTKYAGRMRVLFAGQLTLRKGLPYVLEAVSHLKPRDIELRLVGPIVGSGRWMDSRAGEFRYDGALRPQDMPLVYGRADVLVLPSLVEGSAIVVYEAMASGVPVIVTPNVGADLVRDGVDGFVVPIRSSQAIADCLERLAQDPELRAEMGSSARKRALAYAWPTFRRTFRELCLNGTSGEYA